jgi:hypothetical protein
VAKLGESLFFDLCVVPFTLSAALLPHCGRRCVAQAWEACTNARAKFGCFLACL